MPYMVICKKDDGQVLVSAGAECPPELLQDAQPATSVEEAAQMVKDVLGDAAATTGQEQTATDPAGEQDQPADTGAPSGAEGMPMETTDDQMAAGFQRAKKGY